MIRSILGTFSARLAVAFVNFAVLLFTTNELGTDVRGKISLIQLGVQLIHLISDMAGGPAMVYLVPRVSTRKLFITAGIWAIFSAIVMGGILLWLDLIPGVYGIHVLGIGLLASLSAVIHNTLLGQERIPAYNLLLLLQGGLLISGFLFSLYGVENHSALVYIHGSYLSWGIVVIIGSWLVFRHKHIPKLTTQGRSLFVILFTNGFFTQAASLTHQLSIRENFYRLRDLTPGNDTAVGLYSTAISLGEAILLFSSSIASILMARIANATDSQELRLNTLRLSKLSILITIPALLTFALLPASFYSWLLGKDFEPVHGVFLTLIPGIALISFGTVYAHYFSGTGRHYWNFIAGLFGLLLALLSAQPLIQNMGLNGAGLSASIAYGALSLFCFGVFLFARKDSNEWKVLLPSRDDWNLILKFIGKK
jgi:O-antigen/teichoic acid export membrane protein